MEIVGAFHFQLLTICQRFVVLVAFNALEVRRLSLLISNITGLRPLLYTGHAENKQAVKKSLSPLSCEERAFILLDYMVYIPYNEREVIAFV